ncbi:hypothetical protein MPER_06313, partial [Moniliophthora perniciosa FA553]
TRLVAGTLLHIPWSLDLEYNLACGIPSFYNVHKEWKRKKVVVFLVPGAFTPTCHINHLPGYVEKVADFKARGVDIIAVLAASDAFVTSRWGRLHGTKDKILTLSDSNANWSRCLGLARPDSNDKVLGMCTARYARIIDDLVIKYVGVSTGILPLEAERTRAEPERSVTVSGADSVLANL